MLHKKKKKTLPHDSQSGCFDQTLSLALLLIMILLKIMTHDCLHHVYQFLTSASESDKFLKFRSYMALFVEKDSSKQRSGALSDVLTPQELSMKQNEATFLV